VGRVARGDYKKEGVTRVENKTWKGGQLRVVKRSRSNEGGNSQWVLKSSNAECQEECLEWAGGSDQLRVVKGRRSNESD
jgi:hypothetical protein